MTLKPGLAVLLVGLTMICFPIVIAESRLTSVLCTSQADKQMPEATQNVIQIIEVTPQKKVVWALREWTDPDLGPASCIQLLDERGKEENGDLQR